jgi:vancomycin permeability regulator SanA
MINPKRRKKRFLLKVVVGLLAIPLTAFLAVVFMNIWIVQTSKPYFVSAEQAADLQADCILVLGAGVWGETMTPILRDRVEVGVSLYEAGAAKKILFSGDHGRENYDEVNAMKNYALERGVPGEDIFLDHAGFSTYDSMYRARDVFLAERIIVVTQEFHMARALFIARSLGMEANGVTSDLRKYLMSDTYISRERMARVKAFGMGIFEPEPTFLGETIPINGSGIPSHD